MWQEDNHGFAKANNLALHRATGDLVLFLNPDTIIPEDALQLCFKFFQTHADCGALGVRMIDGAGNFLPESKRGFPTIVEAIGKLTGVNSVFIKSNQNGYYANHVDEKETAVIDVISGAFFMARRSLLEKTKGFDERYFMYGEDIDLSYTLQQIGSKNYYFPEVTIIHFKGESQLSAKVHHGRFYGAMYEFINKHHSENKFRNYILRAGIGVSHFLASTKETIKSLTRNPRRQDRRESAIYIVALQDRFNQIIRLLKYAQPPVTISGRVSPIEGDTGAATTTLASITRLAAKPDARFLFCEGPLHFKEIIDLVQVLKKPDSFLFHAEGSRGIVAAMNKNAKSVVITTLTD